MRIAQLAPLAESVPPPLYGGTERVVSWLCEELVRRGHEVTLFASGDSVTSAALVPCVPRALRLADVGDHMPWTLSMLGDAFCRAGLPVRTAEARDAGVPDERVKSTVWDIFRSGVPAEDATRGTKLLGGQKGAIPGRVVEGGVVAS